MSYTFEQIYDASAFHARVYVLAASLIVGGTCFTAPLIWLFIRLSKDGEARRRYMAQPLRGRFSVGIALVLGPMLLVQGARNLSTAINRARGFAADLQSPRVATVEGFVSGYLRSDGNGNSRPTMFSVGGLQFYYTFYSETFNAPVQPYGPIYDGRRVRVTYMPAEPGHPITEILRVAVGTRNDGN